MADTNLQALTSSTIDTAVLNVTTSATDLIAAVTTNHAFKVEQILITNYHATQEGRISAWYRKGGTDYPIVTGLRIPIKTLPYNILVGGPLYLTDGDSVKVQANVASTLTALAPYVDFVD
jgi:hypothetical protein